MQSHESLKSVIDTVNSGKKYPALQLVNFNPEAAAVISKLFKSRDPHEIDMGKKNSLYALNQSQIQAISDNVQTRINDNKNLLQLFPDIELAIQILTSSILSPKDMVSTQIIYKVDESILPSELTLKLLSVVERHMTQYYKVENELNVMLRDMLFITGSYVKLVIPEGILDQVINKNTVLSTEQYNDLYNSKSSAVLKNIGFLGNPGIRQVSLESYKTYTYNAHIVVEDEKLTTALESVVEITDNYEFLKLPKVTEVAREQQIRSKLRRRTGLESSMPEKDLAGLLYKDGKTQMDEFVIMPTRLNAKRKSIGRPLVLQLPSESVIPVHIPGDETKHIGYFVLIDIDGNPITLGANQDCLNSLNNLNQKTQEHQQGLSSLLISRAKKNLANNDSMPSVDHITKVYSSILERDLMDRLKNGMYKTNLTIANNNEIYRVMLARALSNQYTRIVFIPSELVSYFAFSYFDNGVGKSYLENIKVLCSLRAILRFARVMAMTKNAIAITHVNMTLDPNDPDPQKTIEIATHDIVRMRQQYFPLGTIAPTDLVDWIQRAGFEFSFEGHPGLPETKFDFETKELNRSIPDNELDEDLRKQTYMAFGLSPEVVDNGYSSDFATTVIANNILFSKRVTQLQEPFVEHLSGYCHRILLSDTIIQDELIEILKENKGLIEKVLTDDQKELINKDERYYNELLETFVELIILDLPKPDVTSLETQSAAYDNYIEALDKTIDAWINSDSFPSDIVGDVSNNIDSIKSILRNYFIRKWMAENGYMSELNDIVTSDEEGKPSINVYDINKAHMEGVIKSTMSFIESLRGVKQAADADIENMQVEPGETDTSTSESSDTGGEFDMGDEFDMGEEIPVEEESTPEEEKPTEGEETPPAEGEEEPKV